MKKVSLYFSPTCEHCEQLKNWLVEKQISYDGYDVLQDEEAQVKMMKITGEAEVPTLIVEQDNKTEYVIGLDFEKLEKILK